MTLGALEYAVRRPVPYSTRKLGDGAAPASVLIGVATVLFLAVQGHRSLFVIPAWACIQVAVMKWGDRRRLKSIPGVALLAMALLWSIGAAGATIWGHGESTMSWTLAVFGWLLVAAYITPLTERFFDAVAVGAYALAGYIYLLEGRADRALGFTGDQNVASGFMAAAAIYLTAKGRWYLALPLIPAMALTGSRLAWWVGALVLAMVLAKQYQRPIPIMAAFALVGWLSIGHFAPRYHPLTFSGATLNEQVRDRVAIGEAGPMEMGNALADPAFHIVPMGYPGDDSPHSAPVQLYYQGGLLGLLAAATFMASGLWRNRGSPAWWVLVFLLGVSTLDFYAVMPPVSLLVVAAVNTLSPRDISRAENAVDATNVTCPEVFHKMDTVHSG